MLSILTTLALAAAPQSIDPVGVLQRLQVPTDPSGVVSIDVELAGQTQTLLLERHSLRAADFQLLLTRPDGVPVPMPASAPNTWRGEVEGWADSMVTASITDEGLSAIVTDHSTQLEWQVQPAAGYPAGVYSVALSTELNDPQGTCGVQGPSVIQQGPGMAFAGTGFQLCEIALDADFEFYQRNGSSAQATLDDMERVMNRVVTIYERDVDVSFQITAVVIRTNAGAPYTSSVSSTLLDQFQNQWNANFVGVRRDIAHLFTGKNLSGNVIGVAFLGQVCSQFNGYGLSESRFTNGLVSRTGLTAHEIGHNFNSNHCDGNGDCRIMCAGLGGCNQDVSRFGSPSANVIRNFAISRGCLLDLSDALAIPVFDDFPTTALNRDIWISFQGTDITTAGIGEPSAPNSIRVNARNAGNQLDDRLITNKLLLAGETGIELSFYAQHRGVPFGGTLTVEVLDSNDNWLQLIQLVSDGVDETVFTQHTVALPPGAYHNEAQIRIESGVGSTSQNWFIDDFSVDVACGVAGPYCVGAPNSVTIFGADLTFAGSTNVAQNDLDLVVSRCPAGSFGIHLFAAEQIQQPLADGFLCISGPQIFRVAVVQNDASGASTYSLDQNNLPPGASINAGDRVNFQLWYRDTSPNGANLSNGLSIVFCP